MGREPATGGGEGRGRELPARRGEGREATAGELPATAAGGGGGEIADGEEIAGRWVGGKRGNGGRWTATATARLRLAPNGLASLDYSSLLGFVYCDFLKSGNRIHFFVIYRIFCFIFWEFKNGSRVWILLSGE